MFRKQLPRFYELRDLIADPTSPDAIFDQNLGILRNSPSAMSQYLIREKELQGLDDNAYGVLKSEASPYLARKDPNGRGWQQLFNILDQARAYNYLKDIGCSNVRFIPRSGTRAPDLEGYLGAVKVLCEVKTINISDNEVRTRGDSTVGSIKNHLDEGFFRKLESDIRNARMQLQAYDVEGNSRYLVYINPCFDDLFAEYKEEYFLQIDQYLLNNPIFSGIDLVFHNDRTACYKVLYMDNATVVNESEVYDEMPVLSLPDPSDTDLSRLKSPRAS